MQEKTETTPTQAEPNPAPAPAAKPAPIDRQEFLARMEGATRSHVVISDKRALVMTIAEGNPEPGQSHAPLPQGTRLWYWEQFQELIFLIPGREPFRVSGVQSYEIKKWAEIGLRRVGKNGPFVRAVHKN